MNRFDWHDTATHPPLGQLVLVHVDLAIGRHPHNWWIVRLEPVSHYDNGDFPGWAPFAWHDQYDDYIDVLNDQEPHDDLTWTPLPNPNQ